MLRELKKQFKYCAVTNNQSISVGSQLQSKDKDNEEEAVKEPLIITSLPSDLVE